MTQPQPNNAAMQEYVEQLNVAINRCATLREIAQSLKDQNDSLEKSLREAQEKIETLERTIAGSKDVEAIADARRIEEGSLANV